MEETLLIIQLKINPRTYDHIQKTGTGQGGD